MRLSRAHLDFFCLPLDSSSCRDQLSVGLMLFKCQQHLIKYSSLIEMACLLKPSNDWPSMSAGLLRLTTSTGLSCLLRQSESGVTGCVPTHHSINLSVYLCSVCAFFLEVQVECNPKALYIITQRHTCCDLFHRRPVKMNLAKSRI